MPEFTLPRVQSPFWLDPNTVAAMNEVLHCYDEADASKPVSLSCRGLIEPVRGISPICHYQVRSQTQGFLDSRRIVDQKNTELRNRLLLATRKLQLDSQLSRLILNKAYPKKTSTDPLAVYIFSAGILALQPHSSCPPDALEAGRGAVEAWLRTEVVLLTPAGLSAHEEMRRFPEIKAIANAASAMMDLPRSRSDGPSRLVAHIAQAQDHN
jgi:hypothetical protein